MQTASERKPITPKTVQEMTNEEINGRRRELLRLIRDAALNFEFIYHEELKLEYDQLTHEIKIRKELLGC